MEQHNGRRRVRLIDFNLAAHFHLICHCVSAVMFLAPPNVARTKPQFDQTTTTLTFIGWRQSP